MVENVKSTCWLLLYCYNLYSVQGSHFGGPKGSESPWHRMMTAVSATKGEIPVCILRPRPLSSLLLACHQSSLPPQAHSCVPDVL